MYTSDQLLLEIASNDYFRESSNVNKNTNFTTAMSYNNYANFDERLKVSGTKILAYLENSYKTVPSSIASQLLFKPSMTHAILIA